MLVKDSNFWQGQTTSWLINLTLSDAVCRLDVKNVPSISSPICYLRVWQQILWHIAFFGGGGGSIYQTVGASYEDNHQKKLPISNFFPFKINSWPPRLQCFWSLILTCSLNLLLSIALSPTCTFPNNNHPFLPLSLLDDDAFLIWPIDCHNVTMTERQWDSKTERQKYEKTIKRTQNASRWVPMNWDELKMN